jgi:hypothetical protein
MQRKETDLARTPERLLTMREAAEALGLPYFKIQRSVRLGLLPSYRLLNSRRYVKVHDILERMAEEDHSTTSPSQTSEANPGQGKRAK